MLAAQRTDLFLGCLCQKCSFFRTEKDILLNCVKLKITKHLITDKNWCNSLLPKLAIISSSVKYWMVFFFLTCLKNQITYLLLNLKPVNPCANITVNHPRDLDKN